LSSNVRRENRKRRSVTLVYDASGAG
jgi:hypothetical protein